MPKTTELQDQINQQIGQNLRERRELLGFSAASIGKDIAASGAQVSKYERGQDKITAAQLLLAAEALHCDVKKLYVGCKEKIKEE